MSKRPRVFGTTEEVTSKAEKEVGFRFTPSFRQWLLNNNGRQPENVTIKPVFDERDPRSTFDSIVREFKVNWLGWQENLADEELEFGHLLPISTVGTSLSSGCVVTQPYSGSIPNSRSLAASRSARSSA